MGEAAVLAVGEAAVSGTVACRGGLPAFVCVYSALLQWAAAGLSLESCGAGRAHWRVYEMKGDVG